jgi:AraC family transcriptional regulator of adaptative response/methylated-DNA-[protein]-cysteine methyltransferase
MTIHYATGPSTLGLVLVARSVDGVRAVLLGDDRDALVRELHRRIPHATLVDAQDALAETVANIVALVESPARAFELPLDVSGTTFQRSVWSALREIPAGATATYGEIAQRIGAPSAIRAVAAACAANPLAVVVPCHRVVRRDGALAGYRWGLDRKRALLDRETADREAAT